MARNNFNLALPPRSVPLFLRLKILFGGFLNQFGWFFFGFGMIFFWIFAMGAIAALFQFSGTLETVQAKVTKVKSTGAKVNERRVYATSYSFVHKKQPYKGTSYSTGKTASVGETVTVEFPQGKPQTSRIKGKGMRSSEFPIFTLFVLIFPFIGLCFIIAGFKSGIKGIYLLANGLIGEGTLKSKEPTNTQINNRTVHKFIFEFKAEDGVMYEAIAKTHETEKLEDQAQEQILYDPFFPSYAVLMDSLPGSPQIDDMGSIQSASMVSTMLVLIVPGLSIFGHGLYLLTFFQ